MNAPYAFKRAILRPMHTMYQCGVLAFLFNTSVDYATKVTYNRDRDLVFVERPDGIWNDKESVYEMHHLEQLVPSAVSGFRDIGSAKKDGLTKLSCMSTREQIKLYNEDKY